MRAIAMSLGENITVPAEGATAAAPAEGTAASEIAVPAAEIIVPPPSQVAQSAAAFVVSKLVSHKRSCKTYGRIDFRNIRAQNE